MKTLLCKLTVISYWVLKYIQIILAKCNIDSKLGKCDTAEHPIHPNERQEVSQLSLSPILETGDSTSLVIELKHTLLDVNVSRMHMFFSKRVCLLLLLFCVL